MPPRIVFLLFLFLGVLSHYFLDNSIKLIVYDLTSSKVAVSIIGSVTAFAFIIFGTFSGTIVDAISRKFFVYLQLISGFTLSSFVFILFYSGNGSVYTVLGLVFLLAILNVFSSAAKGSIFYDIVGDSDLSRWISFRSITISLAMLMSFFSVSQILDNVQNSFVVYAILLLFSAISFRLVGYTDKNVNYRKHSHRTSFRFYVASNLKAFAKLYRSNRALRIIFALSFAKTVLIFWPMSSGALFKFGIESEETRGIYLFAAALMQVTTIVSTFLLGKYISFFTQKSFILGIIVSGLGIAMFSRADSTLFLIIFLALLYIGLAVSQMSGNFILRKELPNELRTQGLSFAVVPYYFGDFCSGLLFAGLVPYFSVSNLLLFSGFLLSIMGTFFYLRLDTSNNR